VAVVSAGPYDLDDGGCRGHEKKLFKRFHLDTRKFVFSNRVVDNWNSLSINQSRFFYSGLSNLNHCEVH